MHALTAATAAVAVLVALALTLIALRVSRSRIERDVARADAEILARVTGRVAAAQRRPLASTGRR